MSLLRVTRFAVVGGLGFVVDAGVLTVLVNGFHWGYYLARLVSFPVALTVTWYVNRTWVFEATQRAHREYWSYFAVQTVGALINFGVYFSSIEAAPQLGRAPVIPLAIGSVVAMSFNYLASSRLVFRSS